MSPSTSTCRRRSTTSSARRWKRSPRRSRTTRASTWRCRQMADQDRALYIISVAAELAGVHPQTLRIYERKGLIEPARTVGRSRRYSDRDIALLRRIQELTTEGVGLPGVARILELEATVARLRDELDAARRDARDAVERVHRSYRRDLVPVPPSTVATRRHVRAV